MQTRLSPEIWRAQTKFRLFRIRLILFELQARISDSNKKTQNPDNKKDHRSGWSSFFILKFKSIDYLVYPFPG